MPDPRRRAARIALAACWVGIAACSTGRDDESTTTTTTPGPVAADAAVQIVIDADLPGAPISPLILGLSEGLDAEQMRAAGIRLNSWGGNPSTRYNYRLGNAWNNGRDFEYRNTTYGHTGDRFRQVAETTAEAGAVTRLAVPTLGWVARDGDMDRCSFPDGDGGCTGDGGADCTTGGPVADPTTTSVESTPASVAAWVRGLIADGIDLRFIAMDNEPELWGSTHYDVHPECPTYEEVLAKYLEYARAVGEAAPDAELMGPVVCCWFDYWRTAPGPADGSGSEYLAWFLERVAEHDADFGQRTLDVVDVHYYPQSDVFNENTDAETNARRLRSTRSLWDPTYVDESWIDDEIAFIPRMKAIIDDSYPGTPLAISEWNFGADTTMNGALAIADALGIYGSQGVYAAAYWRSPPASSPGFFAFKMHGNYDDRGSRFGGRTLPAEVIDADDVHAYAALDGAAGVLRVMLLNEQPEDSVSVSLDLGSFVGRPNARRWTYSAADLDGIVADTTTASEPITLAPYSITVLEVAPG